MNYAKRLREAVARNRVLPSTIMEGGVVIRHETLMEEVERIAAEMEADSQEASFEADVQRPNGPGNAYIKMPMTWAGKRVRVTLVRDKLDPVVDPESGAYRDE